MCTWWGRGMALLPAMTWLWRLKLPNSFLSKRSQSPDKVCTIRFPVTSVKLPSTTLLCTLDSSHRHELTEDSLGKSGLCSGRTSAWKALISHMHTQSNSLSSRSLNITLSVRTFLTTLLTLSPPSLPTFALAFPTCLFCCSSLHLSLPRILYSFLFHFSAVHLLSLISSMRYLLPVLV